MRILRFAAQALLACLALFWLGFAALSGAESGLGGFVANLPNALPWLGLVILVAVAFRWERLGGALVVLAGVGFTVLFQAWNAPVLLLGISLPLIVLGGALIVVSYHEDDDQPT